MIQKNLTWASKNLPKGNETKREENSIIQGVLNIKEKVQTLE